MKIVNVVDLFHPDAGYENNVLSKYMVKFGHEYTILTTDLPMPGGAFEQTDIQEKDKKYTSSTGVNVIRLHCSHYISGRSIWKYKDLLSQINSLSPDLVFFCGNDTYIAIRALLRLKDFGMPVITDSHMLEMASRNPLRRFFQLYYKARIAPIIKKNEIYVIRQQDDDYVERCLGVPKALSPWISFGSDILIFHPDREERNRFRVENGISEAAFVVIYAGKLTEEKGADFLAKTIREKINGNKEIVFVIVGNTQGEFGDKVQKEFEESENRILRFPAQKYSDLPRFYQAADLALFPSQCSMSFYDVEACGVPVLSEANNINIDRCSHRNGWNFVKRDILDFRKKILDILNLDEDTYNDYRKSAFNYVVNHYNYEKKAREYEALFLKVVYSWKEVK